MVYESANIPWSPSTSKGVYNSRPPAPRYSTTWDVRRCSLGVPVKSSGQLESFISDVYAQSSYADGLI